MSAHLDARPIHTAVIGASAGGVEALRNLVAALPPDYAGALLVVLHVAPAGTSVLPQILSRAGDLPASHAEDGEPIEAGRIYVAPPDRHLLVADGHLSLDRGPRVHGYRPAIDSLFRTAAEAWGRNVVGVVLSGVLDDGTAGLRAIKRRGGLAFVQDPEEALYGAMPRSAIECVEPDLIASASKLGRAIAEIASTPPEPLQPVRDVPDATFVEVDRGASDSPQPGAPTGTALRALEERGPLLRRIAARQHANGNDRAAEKYSERADQSVQSALVLREVIQRFDVEEGAA